MQIQTVNALAEALSLAALKAAPSKPTKGGKIITLTMGDRLEMDDFIHLSRCEKTGEIVLRDYHPMLRLPLCGLYQRNGKLTAVDTNDDGRLTLDIFLPQEIL